jgi:hypothetical protein
LVSNYATAELKTIQILPPWCWEGIRMFTALEVCWMVLFQWVHWEVQRGCRAGWGATVWYDTYLSCPVELDQAQHSYGKVRSRTTR